MVDHACLNLFGPLVLPLHQSQLVDLLRNLFLDVLFMLAESLHYLLHDAAQLTSLHVQADRFRVSTESLLSCCSTVDACGRHSLH